MPCRPPRFLGGTKEALPADTSNAKMYGKFLTAQLFLRGGGRGYAVCTR